MWEGLGVGLESREALLGNCGYKHEREASICP